MPEEELQEQTPIEEVGEAISPVEPTEPAPTEEVQEQEEEAPPSEEAMPEGETPGGKPKEEGKETKPSSLQKRFNKLAEDKRILREKNAYLEGVAYGRQQVPQNVPSEPQPAPKPKVDDFEDEGDFIEALTDWKVEQKSVEIRSTFKAETAQTSQQASIDESKQRYNEKVEEVSAKHEDFRETLESLPIISQVAVDAITVAENGPEIAYYLGKNHTEANKIARMSPMQAVIAIGRIDGKLSQQSPTKTITKAPIPINPLGGGREATKTPPEKMSTADYIAMREKEEGYGG